MLALAIAAEALMRAIEGGNCPVAQIWSNREMSIKGVLHFCLVTKRREPQWTLGAKPLNLRLGT